MQVPLCFQKLQHQLDVQVRGIEPTVMDIEEKAERFDVNCNIENGDQVNIEMHCLSEILDKQSLFDFIIQVKFL